MDIAHQEAIRLLESLKDYEKSTCFSYEQDLRLERVGALLDRLGNPERSFQAVHVAGTRGKGSVAAMVYSILKASGISVGLYTSPHLVSRRERIRITEDTFHERTIDEEELAAGILKIQPHLEILRAQKGWEFTFFELFTVLAFCFFSERRVSHAVLEVGMGGRLDATNVVTPRVCAITPISYDHTDKLGKTLGAIAREKAGILKKGIPAVIGPQPKEALDVIRDAARERGVPLIEVDSAYRWGVKRFDFSGQHFWVKGPNREYPDLEIPLLGEHQLENAVVALALCETLKEGSVETGFPQVRWPGRFQILEKDPFLVVDGAQNGASAQALGQTLLEVFPNRPYHMILGLSEDKEIDDVCRVLCPMATEVVATRSQSVRALLPEELAKAVRRYCGKVEVASNLSQALGRSRERVTKEGVIVVTGSLYLVGEALSL